MRIIELFAGIGACSKALKRLGIDLEIVDAVEIDKYAMKSYNAIHRTNFEPQDITKWNKHFDNIDLIMHGSPCQDFSLAGKQAGGDKDSGTRSSLMYETIRIVENIKPKYVIWENVKNLLSKKHIHNFNAYLETMESLGYKNYYQVLNAKDYGIPQNRERVITVSILGNENYEFPKGSECNNKIQVVGNYMPSGHDASRIVDENGLAPTVKENHGTVTAVLQRFEFPPKQELKLRLKDLLEDEVDEKYYLSEKMIKYISADNEKWTGNNDKSIINKSIASAINTGEGHRRCDASNYVSNDVNENYNLKTKLCNYLIENNLVKENDVIRHSYSNSRMNDWKNGRNIEKNNEAPTLDTRCDCLGVVVNQPRVIGGIGEKKSNNGTQWYQQDRIYDNNIGLSLSTTAQPYYPDKQLRIRKLTPKECWRLMGFDDEDFEKAQQVNSNAQLYKQAGNSIVVNVLEAIFTNLLKEK